MDTTTIRISRDKRNILKAISSLENKKMGELITEFIDEYIERHKETLELLSIPGIEKELLLASKDLRQGKGTSLDEARKILGD